MPFACAGACIRRTCNSWRGACVPKKEQEDRSGAGRKRKTHRTSINHDFRTLRHVSRRVVSPGNESKEWRA